LSAGSYRSYGRNRLRPTIVGSLFHTPSDVPVFFGWQALFLPDAKTSAKTVGFLIMREMEPLPAGDSQGFSRLYWSFPNPNRNPNRNRFRANRLGLRLGL
jgi:hypothetical protein